MKTWICPNCGKTGGVGEAPDAEQFKLAGTVCLHLPPLTRHAKVANASRRD